MPFLSGILHTHNTLQRHFVVKITYTQHFAAHPAATTPSPVDTMPFKRPSLAATESHKSPHTAWESNNFFFLHPPSI
jgi:hypothetical protein